MKRFSFFWTCVCSLTMTLLLVPMVAVSSAAADGPSKNQELRVKLEQAYRILYTEGLAVDYTRGHITARSEDGMFYIKPYPAPFETVKADEMVGIDIDGNTIEGKGQVPSEKFIHLGIFRARKDVGSVIHIHPTYSIILSTVFKGSIVTVGQQAVHFTGNIPYYTDASLINSKAQGDDVARALGNNPVILMKNHGITVAGRTLEEAVFLAVSFEQSARDHLLASQFGNPSGMNLDAAKALHDQHILPSSVKGCWDYLVEKSKRYKF
jgi:L-ribulose-5-phosphate 4-epimerase